MKDQRKAAGYKSKCKYRYFKNSVFPCTKKIRSLCLGRHYSVDSSGSSESNQEFDNSENFGTFEYLHFVFQKSEV